MENKRFSFSERLVSFKFAFNGLKQFFRFDHNGRIHVFCAIIAICFSFWLNISAMEWVAICIAIFMVLVTEIFNTAIEKLADLVIKEIHPEIKIIKDLAAGAVLLTAILALIIGAVVFLPKIWLLITLLG